MKRRYFMKSQTVTRLLAITTIVTTTLLPFGGAWGAAVAPLSTAVNPVFGTTGANVGQPPATTAALPNGLPTYVKDVNAAIQLGKALFWDMQVGSDGLTACATCHHRAGADPIKHAEDALSVRDTNELNPGFNNSFDASLKAANVTLNPLLDFPFFPAAQATKIPTSPANATTNAFAAPVPGFDDVVGSQGVVQTDFVNITAGSSKDQGAAPAAASLNNNFKGLRQVTGRNTPSTVNAVFNFANFWDGRAHNLFNGSNPIGPLDANPAGIWVTAGVVGLDLALVNKKVSIPNASLASQACGPPLSSVEMSFGGRTFPQLGRKMLALTPLALQAVSATDSVLGPLSNSATGGRGLKTTYPAMIQAAFQDNLWNSGLTNPTGFTQMEANFSFFWGLSVMLYEATLVSDQTPFDKNPTLAGFVSTLRPAGNAANGLAFFNGNCAGCHSGAETTLASVSNVVGAGTPTAPANLFNTAASPLAPRTAGLSDTGFTNIGVRPTGEDLGRGNDAGFPLPLSFSTQALAGGNPLGFPTVVPPAGAAASVNGAFKIPMIRNVALTGPYFHNGSADSLNDVIELYKRGGNFNNIELDNKALKAFAIGNVTRDDLVAFFDAMTDPRVAAESAPFDHPELIIPNGSPEFGHMKRLPARKADGVAEVQLPQVEIDPAVPATINSATMTVNGKMETGASLAIQVNGGPAAAPDTTGDTTFSSKVSGLHAGDNTITISANDLTGGTKSLTKTVTVAFPSGIVTAGAAAISVADALRAMRIAIGLVPQTADDLKNGDVAPLVGGVPAPDGKIDVADALIILRKVVGLEHF
jgi:cytochrome c peroxidase